MARQRAFFPKAGEIHWYAPTRMYRGYGENYAVLTCSNDEAKIIEKMKLAGYSDAVIVTRKPDSNVVPMVKPVAASTAPKQACAFSVHERFKFIEKFVRNIGHGVFPSLIITGDGGLGKSFTVIKALKDMGMTDIGSGLDYDADGDYLVIKGFSTAKAMYRTLYENNGKIIIFDDCDSVTRDAIASNILKGALDSNEKRVISWGAEMRGDDSLPSRFEFTGKIIFISNLSLKDFPQALQSRSLRVDLTLSTQEKVDRISEVFEGVEADDADKDDVISFIRKHAELFTDLNVRTGINLLKLRQVEVNDAEFNRIALYTATA